MSAFRRSVIEGRRFARRVNLSLTAQVQYQGDLLVVTRESKLEAVTVSSPVAAFCCRHLVKNRGIAIEIGKTL